MFIGDLVKLKSNIIRSNTKEQQFIQNANKEGWIWLITSIDDEDLDYVIQPLYLEPDYPNMTQLGGELLVLYDEIEKVELNRDELFTILNNQMCNC